jgi:TolB-like protein
MADFLARLRQRKLVQWTLAYVAFGFALLQGIDIVAQRFAWPASIEQLLILALAVGFCVTLVLAWYHGERGAQRVSGTELGILAVLLVIGGMLLWRFEHAALAATQAMAPVTSPATALSKSVAVLPFVNMSGDPANEYFSDGVTEEILNALTQVPDLKVAARTSAFAFKGKAEDLRAVGLALGVATVLEGSVQRAGDEVRITAQLIDARNGYHLWSEKYDRKLTNIFAVEDEISQAIAEKLKVQLAGTGGRPLVAQATVDPRAHDFYLRGLTLLAARSVSEAVAAFQQAVTIDPGYAHAWAALAEAQALLPTYGPEAMQSANADAISSARHALTLDPGNAQAYVALGMVYSNQRRWADADRVLRHAVQLAPGDAEVLNQYAQFLEAVGQLDAALVQLDRALQRDPLSGVSGAIRVQLRLNQHRDTPATAAARIGDIVAAHPGNLFVHRSATLIYLALRRYPEAEAQVRQAGLVNGSDPDAMALVIRGIADPSQRARALRSLETDAGNANLRRDPVVHALYLMQLDERDRALDLLGHQDFSRTSTIPQLLWLWPFDPVRDDPRFKAVLARLGLPYAPMATNTP